MRSASKMGARPTSKSNVLAAIIAVATIVPAHAALTGTTVSTGSASSNALQDSDSGLTWLSPRATVGLTFDQASLNDWSNLGYRHASTAEFLTLLSHAGVAVADLADPNLPYPQAGWNTPGKVEPVKALMLGLGTTLVNSPGDVDNPFGQQWIYGVLADQGTTSVGAYQGNDYALMSGSQGTASITIANFGWKDGTSDQLVGHFMVQAVAPPVPEPASLLLMAIGLIALLPALRQRI